MTQRGQIVLVRHARPVIDPAVAAGSWPMSASARVEVERLAAKIAGRGCDVVVTSGETKARMTGDIIAQSLGLPMQVDVDLGEQAAGTVPWFDNEQEFRARVVEHFRRPEERVFGEESSGDAVKRLAGAISRWNGDFRRPLLVSHGRVMSAYIASVTDTDPVEFWQALRMPDAFVVDAGMRRWWRIDKEG